MIVKNIFKICLFFVFLGLSQIVYAQRFSPDYWHDGGVVLKSGDTLTGKLYYTLSDNSVQLEVACNKRFYKAFKLQSVFFENVLDSTLRTVYVYNYKLPNGYEQPQLFEPLYVDSIVSLLGRERLVFMAKGPGIGGGVEMGYDFYVKFKNGRIKYISPKKKEFLDAFPDEKKRLADFIKERKTDFNSLRDVKELVAFYNLIKQI